MEQILDKLIEYGSAIAALFVVWQILKVVLSYRQMKPAPIFQNGTAAKVLEVLGKHSTFLEKQIQLMEEQRSFQIEQARTLGNLHTNITLLMDRQQTDSNVIKDIARRPNSRRRRLQ
jgi:hypothetical protein